MIAITPILLDDALTEAELAEANATIRHDNGTEQMYDDHDCPKQQFLDDPITQYYGVGADFIDGIYCYWCEQERLAWERDYANREPQLYNWV